MGTKRCPECGERLKAGERLDEHFCQDEVARSFEDATQRQRPLEYGERLEYGFALLNQAEGE